MTASTTTAGPRAWWVAQAQLAHLLFLEIYCLQIGVNIWNNLIEPKGQRTSVYGYNLKIKCPQGNQSISISH